MPTQYRAGDLVLVRDENGKMVPLRSLAFKVDEKGVAVASTASGGGTAAAWADITGKPSTFPPDVHSHDYAATDHDHAGVYQPAGSYAAASHNHDGVYALADHSHTAAPGGSVAWADITGKPTYLYHMEVPWHSDNSANLTLTNQGNAEQALGNQQTRARKLLDLSNMTQARLIVHLSTASVSVNTPRLYLTYATTYAGSRIALASGANPELSLATPTGPKDTGWFDIAAGARADNIFVEVTQNGGDGAADPVLGYVHVLFRG